MTFLRGDIAKPQTVPVRVCEVNLSTPGLFHDRAIELLGDLIQVLDPEVDEAVGGRVPDVL